MSPEHHSVANRGSSMCQQLGRDVETSSDAPQGAGPDRIAETAVLRRSMEPPPAVKTLWATARRAVPVSDDADALTLDPSDELALDDDGIGT